MPVPTDYDFDRLEDEIVRAFEEHCRLTLTGPAEARLRQYFDETVRRPVAEGDLLWDDPARDERYLTWCSAGLALHAQVVAAQQQKHRVDRRVLHLASVEAVPGWQAVCTLRRPRGSLPPIDCVTIQELMAAGVPGSDDDP